MKVLVVARGKPCSDYPLNGCFEFDQAIALASMGVDVDYIAIDLRSFRRKRKWGVSHGEEHHVKWHVISIPLGALPVTFLCFVGRIALNYIYNSVFYGKLSSPEIIHAHFTEIGYMSSTLSKKTGIPLVITEHSSKMNQKQIAPALLNCAEVGYNQASKIIAVSKRLACNIKEKTGIEAVVIPNLVKFDVFSRIKKNKHNGFVITTTSNLISIKRTINLIKAVEELHHKYGDISLNVIGDGVLRNKLINYVENHGLGSCIKLHGYLPSGDIANIYSKTDCFAMVSLSETFGVVYIEAMASGIPVIATKCGGPEDFVNDNNGLLVEVDNHKQLCDAIVFMYENYSSYYTDVLRSYVEENFSPESVARKIIELYNTIL